MAQLPSHLCVFCGDLASSQSFQLPLPDDGGAGGGGTATAQDHNPAAAAAAALQEMFALLGSLSAVPPRTYEVAETQFYDPAKQVLFRVQRLRSGSGGSGRRSRRRKAPDLMCAAYRERAKE
jgi:hypothetical protein